MRIRPSLLAARVLAVARETLWAGDSRLSRLPFSSGPWPPSLRVALALFSLVLFAPAVGQMTAFGAPLGVAYALGALQTLPIVLVPRAPLAAWRIAALGMAVGSLSGAQDAVRWPWPAASCIAHLILLVLLAFQQPRPVAVGAALVTVLVIIVPGVLVVGMRPSVAAASAAVVVVVVVLGDAVRVRRVAELRLTEQEELRRADRARQSVLEERSRIARELHDVVAHHVSMIAIQAEAAAHRQPDLSSEAQRTLEVIRSAATTALTEMRRVVGLLREADDPADRLPQPTVADIAAMVDRAREAGMSVELTLRPGPPPPAGAAVSAYRIVQEAMSNASRHAPGARVVVTVVASGGVLRLRVANDPPPLPAPQRTGPPGHGLVGMRERAAMLGGRISAGPTVDGGFEVVAVLPIAPPPPAAGAADPSLER